MLLSITIYQMNCKYKP